MLKKEIYKSKKKIRLNDTRESFTEIIDENVEFFERDIFMKYDELKIVAEHFPTYKQETLALFEIMDYRKDFFDGIEPSWLFFKSVK